MSGSSCSSPGTWWRSCTAWPAGGFADRYAHLYYELAPAPALAFPETERPNLLDFAYFSFTIGSSFAASDVEVRSRVLRYTVLTHSVVSFFYNAAILSIAIGVITGI